MRGKRGGALRIEVVFLNRGNSLRRPVNGICELGQVQLASKAAEGS